MRGLKHAQQKRSYCTLPDVLVQLRLVPINGCLGAIVLKKSLFGDARFIGALRSGIQKIAWGTSRFSA